MRGTFRWFAVVVLLCIAAPAQFGPQWSGENPPRNGACFYNGSEYRGMYFCVGAGDTYPELPSHFRNKISSVRIRGSASVELFSAAGLGGERLQADQNIPDLSKVAVSEDRTRTWKKRVESLRVKYDVNRKRPGRRTDGGPMTARPRQGACFYTQADFQGKSVCLQAGDALERLPDGFEKTIVSIRVFGHNDVVVYEGEGFNGASDHLWSSVRDLGARLVSGDQYKTWSKRVASVEIR